MMVYHTPLIKKFAILPAHMVTGETVWWKTYYRESWDAEDAGQVISGSCNYTEEDALALVLKGEKEVNHDLLPFHNFVMFITDIRTLSIGFTAGWVYFTFFT